MSLIKNIYVENNSNQKLGITPKDIKQNIKKLLDHLTNLKGYELSVLVTDDEGIQKLNLEKRGKDKSTDVLSFPIQEKDIPDGYKILGEVVISIDTMRKQAREIGHTDKDEFYRLLVHGILHLLGYDHEKSPYEEKRMQQKEDECLKLIG
jgi:probable rRNA maturation factor